MNSENEYFDINELLILLIENDLTDSQRNRLIEWSRTDPNAVNIYHDFLRDYSLICKGLSGRVELEYGPSEDAQFDQALWCALLEQEKTAPGIGIPRKRPERELITKVVYRVPAKRKISKFAIFTLLNTAAVVLLFLFLKYSPPKDSIEVATLTDSLNAKWGDARGAMETGTRLHINKTPVLLSEGLVELHFDNNTKVVIEGPAEFLMLAADRLGLNYGKVYVTVPKEATGFSVYSEYARIIDLGTEFGVDVNTNGNISLHVIKGRTALLVGKGSILSSIEVPHGIAKAVEAATATTAEIRCDPYLFVRSFNSKKGMVWKGQSALSLADIAGGGNGFGTGHRHISLSPVTGKLTAITLWDANRKSDNAYRHANENPFIDGVFVPNGRTDQIISSQGHVFSECPITQGNYFTGITNTPEVILKSKISMGGINYSQSEFGTLFLHANLGITYDLSAIRSQLPAAQIVRFRSDIGVCDSITRPCNADFWVLVDGQLRYSREKVQQKGVSDTVDIELPKNARFLTLVTTDGGDPEAGTYMDRTVTSMDSDWCMFAEPILILE